MLLRRDSIKLLKDVITSVNASATDAGLWLPRQRQTPHHAHCRPQPATDDTANNASMDLIGNVLNAEAKVYDDDMTYAFSYSIQYYY